MQRLNEILRTILFDEKIYLMYVCVCCLYVGGSRIAAMNLECQILNDKKHVKEFLQNVCQKYLYK